MTAEGFVKELQDQGLNREEIIEACMSGVYHLAREDVHSAKDILMVQRKN